MRSLLILLTLALPASAQDQWKWPDEPKNLQVLPKDTTGAKLGAVMRGFTRSLGVRCTYCHVGEEGKPLSTYDFASDANPNKDRAREMIRMMGSIQQHLKKLEPSGDARVSVGCITCHQGRPRPMTLEEALGEAHRSGGVDAAIKRHGELKARYHGRGGYDFGERSLITFGTSLLEKGDAKGAIAILELNATEFPKSSAVFDSLGEAYLASGDKERAKSNFKKALELDPKNQNAAKRLKELEP